MLCRPQIEFPFVPAGPLNLHYGRQRKNNLKICIRNLKLRIYTINLKAIIISFDMKYNSFGGTFDIMTLHFSFQ
jgi:hypothetical protein